MSLHVWLTLDADADIAALAVWWSENRPAARDQFDDEIRRAWQLLAESPNVKVGERLGASAAASIGRV